MTRLPLLLVAALAAAISLSAGLAPAPAGAAVGLGATERSIVRHVNGARARYGLPPVHASRALSRAAEHHSIDMLVRNFFDHPSSDGTPFDRRVRRYTRARAVGETLAAISRRSGLARTVVRMWMSSPPHRAVLLSGGFRRIGVARRWGNLGGMRMAVVTADFASRG